MIWPDMEAQQHISSNRKLKKTVSYNMYISLVVPLLQKNCVEICNDWFRGEQKNVRVLQGALLTPFSESQGCSSSPMSMR